MGQTDEVIIEEHRENHKKKGRQRKKQLYNTILQQMEFYFSDSNLSKDRFLSKLIAENPYVDLEIFFKFNKILKLTSNITDIQRAIRKSDLIELSEDNKKVCRKKPLRVKENANECTIYVENIKSDANHEWLNTIFSEFGNVLYVSIPKYTHNKANKGFAFIEFETEKEAENCLEFFESIGCKMPSETNPEDLRSIRTFEEASDAQDVNPKKRKLSEDDDATVETAKKQKTEGKTENEEVSETDDDSKKKKKAKKRKNFFKELGFLVLSRQEWKKLRNCYLDLQKKKMKEFKQYLNKGKFSQKCFDKTRKPEYSQNGIEEQKSNSKEELPPVLEFIPGVIVKVKLPEPCIDAKKLKNEIKACSTEVQYVDIPLPAGCDEAYVRFGSSVSAKEFCKQEFNGERTLLENDEEKTYWDKIKNDRSVKFAKLMKKQRGRDKLLKKAEREIAKHIRFTEGE